MAYLIIVGPAYPFRGGIAAFNESLARTWQNMGHQVEIYTFTTQYPTVLFPGKTQYEEGPAPQDLKITRALSTINPITWWHLGQKIKKAKPDLVLFRFWLPFIGPSLGTVARIIKQNKHSKIVALTDNVLPHEKRPGDRGLTKYFLDPCDAFVTMSATVTAELETFKQHKPIICQPHPIYDTYGTKIPRAEALQTLNLPEGKYILFFGFIRHYKGLDLLLEAMTDKRLQERGVRLLVAGEFYENAKPYLEYIDKYTLHNQVVLATEYVSHEKVSAYFSVADLVVQPYRHASQSGVTQIAYHFEVPMIVTKVGGLAEMIPDQKVGYVVDVKPTAIATAIDTFYKEESAIEMQDNIKEEKKKYTWEALANAVMQVASLDH